MSGISNRSRVAAILSCAVGGVSLLSLLPSTADAAGNLLLDPGFEAGISGAPSAAAGDVSMQSSPGGAPTGPWYGWNNWTAPYSGFYTVVAAHTGSQAAKTYSSPNAGIYQYAAVTPGEAYTASAWFDDVSSDALAFGESEDVQMVFFSGPNGTGNNLGTVVSGNQLNYQSTKDTWTQLSLQAAAPAGAQSVQMIMFFANQFGGGGALYTDDTSFSDTSWNGGGADNNWSTANNWGGVAPGQYAPLVFGGTTRLNNYNDMTAGNPYYGMSFTSTAGAFVLNGNQVNLVSDLVNNSTSTQTINLPIGLQPDGANTDIKFNTAAGDVVITGGIGGGFGVIKTGTKTLTLSGSNSYTGLTNVSSGTLVIAAANALPVGNDLSIASGAKLSVSKIGSPIGMQVGALTVSGILDLNTNAIAVHGTSFGTVNSLVQTGFNGGTWTNTTGIISTAAASDTRHITALGTIINDNGSGTPLYGSGGTINTTFDGVSPADGDTLVKYTYFGDTNLDGKVDGSDYSRIDSGFLAHASTWYNGDFNYDGVVNGSDYTLIDNAFNQQSAVLTAELATTAAQVSAVPEPVSISFIGIGAAALLGRRRHR